MKWWGTLLSVFVIAGCSFLVARNDENDKYARQPAQYYASPEPMPTLSTLNYTKFLAVVEQPGVSRVEDVLSRLAKPYREYLRFYTLAYNSFSIQTSSFDEPRAIVFGPDARFIFTFNGPSHAASNTFETIQFDDLSKQFQFREIVMKGDKGDRDLEAGDIDFETPQIIVSKINPGRCVGCHGQTYHPIWDEYHVWPGMYGSIEDSILPREKGRTDGVREQGRFVSIKYKDDIELQAFQDFAGKQLSLPRYKFLPTEANASGTGSNDYFSYQITYRFIEKMAHDIASYQKLRPFRYSILAAIACGSGHADPNFHFQAIAKQVGHTYPETSPQFNQLVGDTYNHQFEQLLGQVSRIEQDLGKNHLVFENSDGVTMDLQKMGNPYFNPDISTPKKASIVSHFLRMFSNPWAANLRNIVEGQGIDMSSWGMEVYPQNYNFRSTSRSGPLLEAFYNGFGGNQFDPSLAERIQRITMTESDQNHWNEANAIKEQLCQEMQKKSMDITRSL